MGSAICTLQDFERTWIWEKPPLAKLKTDLWCVWNHHLGNNLCDSEFELRSKLSENETSTVCAVMITEGQWIIEPPSFWKWCGELGNHVQIQHEAPAYPASPFNEPRHLPESWPYQLAWLLYLPSLGAQRRLSLSLVSTIIAPGLVSMRISISILSNAGVLELHVHWAPRNSKLPAVSELNGVLRVFKTTKLWLPCVPNWVIRTLLPERVLLPVITCFNVTECS